MVKEEEMSEAIKMVAAVRHTFGKGAARKFRAAGRTPAVLYGHGTDPVHITVDSHEIALVLRYKNAVLELDIEGRPQTVLIKSATKDAVTQVIEHIDMVTLILGERVHVEVPVHIVGEAMGGHTIDLIHKTVKLEVAATSIPEFVEVVFNKEGEGFHVTAADVKLPAGAKLDLAPEELIASVLVNAAEQSAETAAAPAAAASKA